MNLLIIIVLVLFLLCFIYIEPMITKHKVKNDNEYGSARFSTDAEVKRNFKKESIYNIKEAGFPVSLRPAMEIGKIKAIIFLTPSYIFIFPGAMMCSRSGNDRKD